MEHTKEPWNVDDIEIIGADDKEIAQMYMYSSHKKHESNARRIVACVNACAGIPTEHLEVGPLALATFPVIKQRDELLSVLKELQQSTAYWSDYDVPLGIVDRINIAIFNAEHC